MSTRREAAAHMRAAPGRNERAPMGRQAQAGAAPRARRPLARCSNPPDRLGADQRGLRGLGHKALQLQRVLGRPLVRYPHLHNRLQERTGPLRAVAGGEGGGRAWARVRRRLQRAAALVQLHGCCCTGQSEAQPLTPWAAARGTRPARQPEGGGNKVWVAGAGAAPLAQAAAAAAAGEGGRGGAGPRRSPHPQGEARGPAARARALALKRRPDAAGPTHRVEASAQLAPPAHPRGDPRRVQAGARAGGAAAGREHGGGLAPVSQRCLRPAATLIEITNSLFAHASAQDRSPRTCEQAAGQEAPKARLSACSLPHVASHGWDGALRATKGAAASCSTCDHPTRHAVRSARCCLPAGCEMAARRRSLCTDLLRKARGIAASIGAAGDGQLTDSQDPRWRPIIAVRLTALAAVDPGLVDGGDLQICRMPMLTQPLTGACSSQPNVCSCR